MSTGTRGRSSAAAEREHHRTNLWAQVARFIGLFLSPLLGLIGAWLIHLWVVGLHVHWGRIDWDVSTSPAAVTLAVCLITLTTVLVAYLAHQFAEHRKPALRNSLAGSVVAVGVMFAVNVGTGPSWVWSPMFYLVSGAVAVIWSIARLDVTRNDKSAEDKDDGFLEKVGLKGWRVRGVKHNRDEHGNIISTEADMQHAQGDVVDQLQDAVPNIESGTGAPGGLSRATPTDRADRSTLTVMHVDPLEGVLELPPPASPGGSIVDPLIPGKYSNGHYVQCYLAGGNAPNPSSYLFMGMTRTGKTNGENIMLTEVGTRRDVVILYLNKAKGRQDVRPIIPITEVAIVADEIDGGRIYRHAMTQIKRMMAYRSRQLAQFGISAWTKECYSSPPWRTDEAGQRVQMEPMPFLICHFGEADAILQEDNGDSVYLASKALSLGIITGWSLQRADHRQMPTGLRFNLGTAMCFGCGDDESAGFALSDHVIKAGAHPERWRQNRPGYFYFEGLGIDDSLFPVHARTFGAGPGGKDLPPQELRPHLDAALLARNLQFGPRMARLDQGTVNATDYAKSDADGKTIIGTDGKPVMGNWWREMRDQTDQLRDELLSRKPANMTPQDVAGTVAADPADDETRNLRADMEAEVRETTHVEGVELYPEIDGDRATPQDATAPLPRVPEGEGLSWADDRPEPRNRQAALEALRKAFLELSQDPSLSDPTDPTGRTSVVTPALIAERYTFRTRPWYSEVLNGIAEGRIEIPGLLVSLVSDGDLGKRRYRVQRVDGDHQP